MVLADTSIWVDHLRHGNARMSVLLDEDQIEAHPFVIGEIAVGHLRRRSEILTLLANLPRTTPAEHDEAMRFVADHDLAGSGLGWIDVHLPAAASLSRSRLWTLDRRLAAVATRLGLAEHRE
jgi:predicted nucleic acid-binding protein